MQFYPLFGTERSHVSTRLTRLFRSAARLAGRQVSAAPCPSPYVYKKTGTRRAELDQTQLRRLLLAPFNAASCVNFFVPYKTVTADGQDVHQVIKASPD